MLKVQLQEQVAAQESLQNQLSESESKLKKEASSEVQPRVVIEAATQRSAKDASLIEDLLFDKQKFEDEAIALK